MKTIDSLGDLAGKRVLVRADLNVPLDGTTITDDGRVRASVATIAALTSVGAKVIVMAHLGRPGGEPNPEYSLAPVAARLAELLGAPVKFATDLTGESAQATVADLANGDVALLELPSPNSQLRSLMSPVEVSLKVTVKGAVPEVGEAVKPAAGAEASTWMEADLMPVPPGPVTVKLTV